MRRAAVAANVSFRRKSGLIAAATARRSLTPIGHSGVTPNLSATPNVCLLKQANHRPV